ncbi:MULTISPECIES: cation diffusion facilitator family transporter [unclassified Fusibacter]|uniref:cation diffusion facilitator family transporter n=1 Tax=unclassified Fusibacter TaxID=2624464 RepID=UPI001012F027|nr:MULTISPECIES: cation diffusion facilitator family transporter [unclassified Fusibacter]MCK8058337.1 cation diffusion facilitator family transporter [Fusibacter sp. A2]NPE20920.1 cation transporter [Fusibacter sp. A1]RXV63123.1 cation transporter [Fusibacter sp. A1]
MARETEIRRVALLGIIGNVILLALKLYIGILTRSQAMIADGFNSAGDVFASAMTYIGNAIASQPDDHDHPYGHGKAEYVFSMIISFSLMLVAYAIFKKGIVCLLEKRTFMFSIWLVVVSLFTIGTKYLLFMYASRVGKVHNSLLAVANAQDHRNDIFVSLITLLSIVTGYFNVYFIDALAAMSIALWIAYTGFSIFSSSYQVLMDTTIDMGIKEQMKKDVKDVEGVDHLDAIVSKPVGLNYLLIVKVSVDADLTVFKGHEIGDNIKEKLMGYELVDDVVVHLNPTQYHPQKEYLK